MSKIEINNEFVLLRKSVRQARICVINKLIREAKKLSINRGSKKQLTRNKIRAEKLLREINALKPIKDDDISKYGMTNLTNIDNILQDPSSDEKTRIMCKVIRFKILNSRLKEFMEKFPDYKEHILASKTKKSSTQKKLVQNTIHASATVSEICNLRDREHNKKDEQFSKSRKKRTNRLPSDLHAHPPTKTEKLDVPSSDFTEHESVSTQNQSEEHIVEEKETSKSVNSVSSPNRELTCGDRAISKEATVKRFNEILHSEKTEEDQADPSRDQEHQLSGQTIKIERQVDDFFVNPCSSMPYSTMAATWEKDDTSSTCGEYSGAHDYSKASQGSGSRNRFHTDMQHERRNSRKGGMQSTDDNQRNRSYSAETVQHRFKDFDPLRSSRENVNNSIIEDKSSKALHPSWVAKKKQQEMINAGFQGKKIRFEED